MAETIGMIREALFGDERRSRRTRRIARIAAPIAVILLALSLWLWLRPYPEPDFATGRIDALMNFTLLRDEFNRLSVEDRLRLLGQLRERLSGLTAGESVLLAAFAGGIMHEARDQLEQNMSRLAIDMWDQYARDYQHVQPDRRGQYLDDAYIGIVRAMETLGGQPSDKSDSVILREAHTQARRHLHPTRRGEGPSGAAMGILFSVLSDSVGQHAGPQQRQRGQLMMRDMARRMRGETSGGG
ncbi:MAG: hypothetical protein IIB55_03730 [Planctomycetes bacterium]|nr:hypothetical protein [Planctomycetota bacterium]